MRRHLVLLFAYLLQLHLVSLLPFLEALHALLLHHPLVLLVLRLLPLELELLRLPVPHSPVRLPQPLVVLAYDKVIDVIIPNLSQLVELRLRIRILRGRNVMFLINKLTRIKCPFNDFSPRFCLFGSGLANRSQMTYGLQERILLHVRLLQPHLNHALRGLEVLDLLDHIPCFSVDSRLPGKHRVNLCGVNFRPHFSS